MIFTLQGPGVPMGPWWCVKSKSCIKQIVFIEGCLSRNSIILVAPKASPVFWPHFLGPWAENQNSPPYLFLSHPPDSKKVWHDPPAPKPWKVIFFGIKHTLRGQGLTPSASWSKSPGQKLLARILVDPENFEQIIQTSQKLQHFFAVMHRRTDAQMQRRTDIWTHRHANTHKQTASLPLWNFFAYV